MAGYNDPETGYIQDAPGLFTHLSHITDITNKFDKDATPAAGDLLLSNGTVYVPAKAPVINAKAPPYNAVGGGSVDDTTALQNWINAVVTAKAEGILPADTYKITSALVVPQGIGWKLRGVGPEASIIRQHTNNTPVLDVGASGSSETHSWEISDLQFTYNASQSAANTNAICIKFSAMGYEGRILRCNFKYGFRGISVASGVVGFWGCTLDDLNFDGGITGSAISFLDGATAGVPNNHFGRMLVTATNMVGPVFYLKGETCKIDTIEILLANQGPRLIQFASGDNWAIDQIKLEVGTYNTTNAGLFFFESGAAAQINYLRVHDITVNNTAEVYLVNTQAQSTNDLAPSLLIRKLDGRATFNNTATGFGVSADSPVIFDEVHLVKLGGAGGTWRLLNHGLNDTADWVQVLNQNRQRVSANLGNADYVITHGVTGAVPSPNVLFFETAFTAQRTVDLPSNGNDLWNGLTYTIIARNGAINGANTLRIRVGSTILRTQTTDNYALTYTYRRRSSTTVDQNWKLTGVANLA